MTYIVKYSLSLPLFYLFRGSHFYTNLRSTALNGLAFSRFPLSCLVPFVKLFQTLSGHNIKKRNLKQWSLWSGHGSESIYIFLLLVSHSKHTSTKHKSCIKWAFRDECRHLFRELCAYFSLNFAFSNKLFASFRFFFSLSFICFLFLFFSVIHEKNETCMIFHWALNH